MLNAPRVHPYEFRVVAFDDWVWLYDDSERTYICDQVPKILLEPLYSMLDDEPEYIPETDYWDAREVEKLDSIAIDNLHPDDTAPDVEEREAWDAAREEAQGNHRI